MLFGALRGAERVVRGKGQPLSGLRNFLILEHSLALGTAIHATPLIEALRETVPGARVIAAASGFGLGVLRGNPGLERLIEMPSPLSDLAGAVRVLRSARPFDGAPFAVLHTTGNLRTRVVVAAMLSGAGVRVGFSVHPELVAASLTFDTTISQIANNLRIIAALGHGERLRTMLDANPALGEPHVFPQEEDFAKVRRMLAGAGFSQDKPLAVFVTQTSPTQQKSWRAERFREVAEMLHRDFRAQVAFAGSAGEAPAVEALMSGLEVPAANFAGQTTLLELAALFGVADVALTLDTGPMHLGRAMRTPMVIVAPAWSPPVEWLPVSNPRVRILKNLTLDSAPPGYVIDEVSVAEVEEALRELLKPSSERLSKGAC